LIEAQGRIQPERNEMKTFADEEGRNWVASAREEDTPRHHGRWYFVIHPEGDDSAPMAMQDVRWQTEATAARTLRTMSEFELRRRLRILLGRAPDGGVRGPLPTGGASTVRDGTNVSAG
jgi:hypothetical protein